MSIHFLQYKNPYNNDNFTFTKEQVISLQEDLNKVITLLNQLDMSNIRSSYEDVTEDMFTRVRKNPDDYPDFVKYNNHFFKDWLLKQNIK